MLLACLLPVLFAGCGGTGGNSAELDKARKLLQKNKTQDALDSLLKDTSAEGAYLKSIALSRQGLPDAAREQLQFAIKREPKNLGYQSFFWRMQILSGAGTPTLVDELISTAQGNKSSALISLCAATGYAAKKQGEHVLESFKTSVSLSDQIPELQPEMLIFALQAQLAEEAHTLIEKLEKAQPDDPYIARQRVLVLELQKKHTEAVSLAKTVYEAEPQSELLGLLYARLLSTSEPKPEYDQAFASLVNRFSANQQFTILQTTYLTRTGRIQQAVKILNDMVAKASEEQKWNLIHLAIVLPLEVSQVEIAEKQWALYQAQIKGSQFEAYYEGRLLLVKREYTAALEKFALVLEVATKSNHPGAKAVANEATIWIEQTKFQQILDDQLKKAAQNARDFKPPTDLLTTPKTEKPDSEKPATENPGTEKTQKPDPEKTVPEKTGTEKPEPEKTPQKNPPEEPTDKKSSEQPEPEKKSSEKTTLPGESGEQPGTKVPE